MKTTAALRWLVCYLTIAAVSAATGPQNFPMVQQTRSAALQITLDPLLTSGLAAPVFLTTTGDGSNRLFIVEQPGRIKVLQPGALSPTTFLDISSDVLFGGEQGLLGLAFHPLYSGNRRFFVDYTRKPDGATVIAEYSCSDGDPNAANPAGSILLVIPQPYSNHNGGMLAFGPDGFLYIGMGDGGSANDPENRAQNRQELLGKILRIDVDRKDPGKPYASPPANPFFQTGDGRDEIFAFGLRNPWRFSFDRLTGRLIAGDVGQGAVEEVDVILPGGNYGWRVFEGSRCTNLGPAACNAGNFTAPIGEYTHSAGRCSITGGYAYRGALGTFPAGTYILGDYCTGEIFTLRDGTIDVLAKTDLQVSSFGEDETGEIFVIGLEGRIYRLKNPEAPTSPALYFPRLVTAAVSAEPKEFTGIAVTNPGDGTANLSLSAFDTTGNPISGTGITNPRTIQIGGHQQLALLDWQVFGSGLLSSGAVGWIKLLGDRRVNAFFLAFDPSLTTLDGADVGSQPQGSFVLPDLEAGGSTRIHIVNPNPRAAALSLDLVSSAGTLRANAGRSINGAGALVESVQSLFPSAAVDSTDYLRATSDLGLVGFEWSGGGGRDSRGLNSLDATAGGTVLYAPQYATGGMFQSMLSLINLDKSEGSATLRLVGDDGSQIGEARNVSIPAKGKVLISDMGFFAPHGNDLLQGYVEITSSGPLLTGSITFEDPIRSGFSASLPLDFSLQKKLMFSQVASDPSYFTGVAIVNPSGAEASVLLEVFDAGGQLLASGTSTIKSGGRVARLLTEYFPSLTGKALNAGYIQVTSETGLSSCALVGTNGLATLSALPSQRRQ